MSLKEPGTILLVNPWECGPLHVFMLMVDFVLHTRSNRPCYTCLSELLCTNIYIDEVYLVSLLGFWVSVPMAGYACMTSPSYKPWTLRLSCFFCSSLGRDILHISLYFVSKMYKKVCVWPLWILLPNAYIFSLAFTLYSRLQWILAMSITCCWLFLDESQAWGWSCVP